MNKQERIQHQQDVVMELYARLDRLNLVCAGGAPRDWDHGNPAKDLDLFFYGKTTNTKNVYDFLVNNFFDVVIKDGQDLPEEYKGNPNLICVYDFKYKGEDVQLIQVKCSVYDYIMEFPCDLSKIFFNVQGKLYQYYEYLLALENNHVVVCPDRVFGEDYFEKVINKYPNYQYFYPNGREYKKAPNQFEDFHFIDLLRPRNRDVQFEIDGIPF